MNIVFLGAPGSGKGTQAARLAQEMGLAHIETGRLLREAVAGATPVGKQAKPYMESGRLVPDEIVIGVLEERLAQLGPALKGMVLDGFPRTVPQAQALETCWARRGEHQDLVLYLAVPREELVRRLGGRLFCPDCGATYSTFGSDNHAASGACRSCGGELRQREDDAPEVVAKRIETYLAQTAPLLDYYRQRGMLEELDGARSIEDIYRDILRLVEEVGAKAR